MASLYAHGFELDTATLKHAHIPDCGGESDTGSVGRNDHSPDASSNEAGTLSPPRVLGEYNNSSDPKSAHRSRRAQKQRVYRERIKAKRSTEEAERSRLKDDNQRLELQNRSMKQDIVDLKKRIAEMEATQRLYLMSRLSPFFTPGPAAGIASATSPNLLQSKAAYSTTYDMQAFQYPLLGQSVSPVIPEATEDLPRRRHSLDNDALTAANSLPVLSTDKDTAAHQTKLQKRLSVQSDTSVNMAQIEGYPFDAAVAGSTFQRISPANQLTRSQGLVNAVTATQAQAVSEQQRERWAANAMQTDASKQGTEATIYYGRPVTYAGPAATPGSGVWATADAAAAAQTQSAYEETIRRRSSWAGYMYAGHGSEYADPTRQWEAQPMVVDGADIIAKSADVIPLAPGHRSWFGEHGAAVYTERGTVW
eukprot:comp20356_c0_seq1/m.25700 comp20356_c0_seq1/g.25700  ORF comp20356_c0_seq1/g.25700 comp20356_c0_seq1/m.25700 type:complete len:422 (-) comp20356_c0_seq1:776-2041(-)